jgi:cytochrome c biogenesis protein CcmG/thiol:disulfide interchange protein DsbE
MRIVRAGALVAVAGLFGLLVWKLTHPVKPAKVGGPVPNFSLQRLEGSGTVSLKSLRGKPTVINFFASWCEPCKAEAGVLESAWQQYKGRVNFVGIDYNDVTSDGLRFLRAHRITFPTVRGGSATIGDRYGLTGVPETFVVDAQGRLQRHITGTLTAHETAFYDGIKDALSP